MAVAHGSVGEFDSSKETWPSYTERLEQYFIANDLTDEGKKKAVFLSNCGATTYQLIRDLVAPGKPTDKSLSDLFALVLNHHSPPPSVTVQRFTFNTKTRKSGETVADYVANLRRLSEHCQFGTSLNDMLRDRLVCGINNDHYQRRLLAESKLNMESADKNVQELRSSDSEQQAEADVKQVLPSFRRFQNDANVRAPCYRCGEDGHHPAACRFKNTECSYCKKIGHIFRACRARGKQCRGRGRRRGGMARQAYQVVQSEEDPGDSPHCEEEEDAYVLF